MSEEQVNKLTREEEFFIRVLRDFLLENQTEPEPSLNWDHIKDHADRQQLSAIFYKQTKEKIFEKSYAFQLYHYQKMKQLVEELNELLKGYEYIMVKGMTVAELYPTPALRSMGDIDLLIHIEDRDKIHKLLLDGGFSYKGEIVAAEFKYEKNGHALEVHDSLVHRTLGKEKRIAYFLQAWDYVKDGKLDWSFHLIYLLEHLRQHFIGQGTGFRQFMDIALVAKKENIDWNFVSEGLKKIDLYEFAATVFAFLEIWFDISFPFKKEDLSEEFYYRAVKKIFADGVFGFDNEENKKNAITKRIYDQGIGTGKAKLQYLRHCAFPPMKRMLRLPYCSYLEKHRFLLPLAWIHRFFYRIVNKEARDSIKAQLADENIKDRMEFLKGWGL